MYGMEVEEKEWKGGRERREPGKRRLDSGWSRFGKCDAVTAPSRRRRGSIPLAPRGPSTTSRRTVVTSILAVTLGQHAHQMAFNTLSCHIPTRTVARTRLTARDVDVASRRTFWSQAQLYTDTYRGSIRIGLAHRLRSIARTSNSLWQILLHMGLLSRHSCLVLWRSMPITSTLVSPA